MDITEVRIKLMEDPQERLQAFCSITFDHCFVIRDLKIIEGAKGSFVAMPSRKLTDRCPRCNTKNQLRALYCNQCGVHLLDNRAGKDADGRAKLYADIAHPINSRCRELIQKKVMDAFQEEQVRARQPGYVCTYDDYGEESYADVSELEPAQPAYAATVGSPGSVHRIESGNGAVNAPHLSSIPESRHVERVAAGRNGDGEEGFGAGIE
ncbi:MAG: septation protein SpoVG family protein [Deltaproteobacteria bacterium]